ncbi:MULTISPECIES: hypothetical protein [unclassified Acinetobacter]|uniref:hypothetical protein n=1 Tax=unclassified Acinetobacter TaxID=196816 RepID=UPI00244890CA|nr:MULTISPECIES: hypothetical protein [unclassified Acinetobacter]MDH0032783.1 hypothetical protein [Acinetobacter sp. GD04021]MDH0888211.1 hypothetical protein [Acinetobacter sp. GD03873]MDH1084562.1 hypothetical protein [Acinetobacter sp. GD03983]MDH2189409.1 hypothetical protein [Acinetobacter sp. GD03645]MDH2205093.1 hypothetical protein [Acinetobacter sp. GD03647]
MINDISFNFKLNVFLRLILVLNPLFILFYFILHFFVFPEIAKYKMDNGDIENGVLCYIRSSGSRGGGIEFRVSVNRKKYRLEQMNLSGTPYLELKKRSILEKDMLEKKEGSCFKVKYIYINAFFVKRAFIYDYLKN